MKTVRTELEKVALPCRIGLMRLVDAKGSTFNGFPSGACGVASDTIGRVVWGMLQYEREYVCGIRHPKLRNGPTHAWFEVGDFIIDVTYVQFHATGLTDWVFDRNDGWHAQFRSMERRQGFANPPGGLHTHRMVQGFPRRGQESRLDLSAGVSRKIMAKNYYPPGVLPPTGLYGLPLDLTSDPDLQQSLSVELVLALDGRVMATLTPTQLRLLQFYLEKGNQGDVVVTIVNAAGAAKPGEANEQEHKDEIIRCENRTVSIVRR